MTQKNASDRNCVNSGAIDFEKCQMFLDGELPASAAADVMSHIFECHICARQLENQGQFHTWVRQAVMSQPPDELVSTIRTASCRKKLTTGQ